MFKKVLLSSLVISSMTLALTACGGSSNNPQQSGDNDQSSTINNAEIKWSEVKEGPGYVYREDSIFRNGSITFTEIPILGSESGETKWYQDETLIFADKFFAKEVFEDLGELTKVSANNISFTLIGNNGKKLVKDFYFASKDISGVTMSNQTNVHTDLPTFNLTDAKFPEGSVCNFIDKYTVNIPNYELDLEDSLNMTLSKWKEKKSVDYELKTTKVGKNNEYTVVYYDAKGEEGQDGWREAVMEYKGKLYDLYYSESFNQEDVNEDEQVVVCSGYNDIAMDYLTQQIKENNATSR